MKLTYNNKYILKDDKPWFPIMGEMHYSRYPKELWKESLYKMKAGGVDVVSTYVLWIHHEEIEGQYDFTGNKDLRAYVETCKECNVSLMLRIGPWCHAETRNGGFPDWLLNKDFEVRTNDEAYFAEIEKLYKKIYEQVDGLFLKDEGPIVGIQIENEYGHCGGLTGEEGNKHMIRLHNMAKEIGFDVPIYTATGWGGAMTGGLLPVMGGYCDAPWDQRIVDIEPSGNYIFTHERNDHNIGSDYGLGEGITFDVTKYPYLTAELGGGLQVTHHRRTVASSSDIGAMSLVKVGSGVNLLVYYMYHGGTNPKGILTTLEENKASGSINDLPIISYDFRAPLRQYGQITDTFKEVKLLATFLEDFGEEICEMPADIPENNPLFPTNLTDLRTSTRHNGKNGYIFVNNYQRRYDMADHKDVELSVVLENENIKYPLVDIANKEYFFYPFNMELEGGLLKSALATPICKLNYGTEGSAVVFYTDKEDPSYKLEGDVTTKIITLSREEALNSWKLTLDKEYLFVSSASVIETDKGIEFIDRNNDITFKVYPDLSTTPSGFEKVAGNDNCGIYKKSIDSSKAEASYEKISENDEKVVYEINIDVDNKANDYFVKLDYVGDQMKLYIDGEYVSDDFWATNDFEISMKHFNYPKNITMEVYPLYEKDEVFIEEWPDMNEGKACELLNVTVESEYIAIL